VNTLLGLLKNPIGDLINSIGGVVDKFVTTGEEKLQAQLKLTELERDFQMKVMELDQQWAATQADVIKAEATSQSYMARNWRPILMLVFTAIIAWNYMLMPILSAFTSKLQPALIPGPMWDLLKIGVGGYIVGRSAEKITPSVVQALATDKKK
jgi:hypothetical protein